MDKVSQTRQDEIDRLYRSPKERAEEVNATLQLAAKEFDIEHTRLDITCFSVQWLASLAVGMLSDDIDFVRIARLANIWLHHKHYNAPEEIYGPPDRAAPTLELISLDEEAESKETP